MLLASGRVLLSIFFSIKLFFDVTITLSIRDSILRYLKSQDSLLTDFCLEKNFKKFI